MLDFANFPNFEKIKSKGNRFKVCLVGPFPSNQFLDHLLKIISENYFLNTHQFLQIQRRFRKNFQIIDSTLNWDFEIGWLSDFRDSANNESWIPIGWVNQSLTDAVNNATNIWRKIILNLTFMSDRPEFQVFHNSFNDLEWPSALAWPPINVIFEH